MCKCVPYLIIVCDMGIGVNARGSDGYYATVYSRCLYIFFLFYVIFFSGRQYMSSSIYSIFEEFHSRRRFLPLGHSSPILID